MSAETVRRRPGGRSAQVRVAVMAATLDVLADSGPAGLTIAEVARRAGVHETSIYRRWGSKERLTLEAMVTRSDELVPVPDTGALLTDLVAFGRLVEQYSQAGLGATLLRSMASSDDDTEAAAARTAFWNARLDECQVMVDRGRQRGELPGDVDARWLMDLFIAPLHFRLLLTRQAVDAAFLRSAATASIAGAGAVAVEGRP